MKAPFLLGHRVVPVPRELQGLIGLSFFSQQVGFVLLSRFSSPWLPKLLLLHCFLTWIHGRTHQAFCGGRGGVEGEGTRQGGAKPDFAGFSEIRSPVP